jgi:hypothetical protein
MSYSFHSAYRSTHLKVVTVALALSTVVVLVSLAGWSSETRVATTVSPGILKASKSIVVTNSDTRTIR